MAAKYLKITARRLLRQKAFSLINVFGLAAGLAACLLIFFYVDYELSYDRYRPNAPRVARLITTVSSAGTDVAVALAILIYCLGLYGWSPLLPCNVPKRSASAKYWEPHCPGCCCCCLSTNCGSSAWPL